MDFFINFESIFCFFEFLGRQKIVKLILSPFFCDEIKDVVRRYFTALLAGNTTVSNKEFLLSVDAAPE